MPRTKKAARKRGNASHALNTSDNNRASSSQAGDAMRNTRAMLDSCFSKADKKLKSDTTAEEMNQLVRESGLSQDQAPELLHKLKKRQDKMRRQLKRKARHEAAAGANTTTTTAATNTAGDKDHAQNQGVKTEQPGPKPKKHSVPKQSKKSKKKRQLPSYPPGGDEEFHAFRRSFLEDDDFGFGRYDDDWPIESTYDCGGKSPSDSMAAGIVNAMMGGYDMWGF